jgi:hypothetical protein
MGMKKEIMELINGEEGIIRINNVALPEKVDEGRP